MLKLLKFTLKLSEVNVCRTRTLHGSAPLFGKRQIRQNWAKNTQKLLKRTEQILAGDGDKNKYACFYRMQIAIENCRR